MIMEYLGSDKGHEPQESSEISSQHDYELIDSDEGAIEPGFTNCFEIVEPKKHYQTNALLQGMLDLKRKLDRIAELYGNDATTDDVVKILEKMARFVDELESDEDDLKPIWVDYARANAAISRIEKEMINAHDVVPGEEIGLGLEKRRYREGYKNSKNKLIIPGFRYIIREDKHSYTTEHQGAHFALEDRNELEVGVVITLDESNIVHLEPHGDKENGRGVIDTIFRAPGKEVLQIINDFTKQRLGEKPIDERRKYSADSVTVDECLPTRFIFRKE